MRNRSIVPSLKLRRDTRWGLIFIAPGVAYFLIFWIAPVILAAIQSLSRWQAGRAAGFIGLKNYVDLLNDPLFRNSVSITAIITAGAVILTFAIALGLALLLNDETLRGARWFRVIIFLPVVTDWVATGLVWQLIFLPYQGVLPGIFYNLGLPNLMSLRWTADRGLAPVAIIIFIVWKTTGLYTVILLAGLKSVPKPLVEAALVDGRVLRSEHLDARSGKSVQGSHSDATHNHAFDVLALQRTYRPAHVLAFGHDRPVGTDFGVHDQEGRSRPKVSAHRACPILGLVHRNTEVHGFFLPFLSVVSKLGATAG